MTKDMRQKYIKRLTRAAQIRGYVTTAMLMGLCADMILMVNTTTRDDITPNYWAVGAGLVGAFACCVAAEMNEKSRDKINATLTKLKQQGTQTR